MCSSDLRESLNDCIFISLFFLTKNNSFDTKIIYIYIYRLNLEKIQLDSTIEVQFCAMCPKSFIFRVSFIS